MKKLILFMMIVCLFSQVQMQAQSRKQVITDDENIGMSIPDSIKYLYPSFTYGKVNFKDGTQAGSILNYNLLAAVVQFINSNGDTLAIASESTIKFITINKDTFYFDKMYLKKVAGNETAKLATQEKISLANVKKAAAFDSYTTSGGVENYSTLNIGSRTLHLSQNKQMVFVVHTFFYIGDAYNHFLPATKKNVLKIFSKQRNVEGYLANHDVDFKKQTDLKALITFIGNNQ